MLKLLVKSIRPVIPAKARPRESGGRSRLRRDPIVFEQINGIPRQARDDIRFIVDRLIKLLNQSLGFLLILPITLYRLTLSPFFGRFCRFTPSCSAYALEALRLHGGFRGSLLAAKRLCRCHPFSHLGGSFGFDPVPRHAKSIPSCTSFYPESPVKKS